MATTSLWHIKGRLKDLIDYVENPDKTTPNEDMKDFFQMFSYAANPAKTNEGEYVSAINCLKETALQQMILTKQQYGKTGKYIAWHGYQSFKPDEISPEKCHEIGLKLAQEMWGDRYQIIVTTHLDKDHLHNHFCFNSVSYLDGGKYNYSKTEQKKLRDVSDKLCREYGLSVINRPKKAPSRPLYLDEKSGKPTRYNIYREDIREAIRCSNNLRTFEKYLLRKGYEVDLGGVHWKLKLPQYKHFTRMDTLDERLTPQGIQAEISRSYNRYGSIPATISYPKEMPQEYRDWFQPFRRTSHIYRLYLYYCYMLGVLPEKTTYKPTSPYLKEDLRKLDEISAQVRYMTTNNISTLSDLHADRDKNQSEMDKLIDYRKHLQNKIRRASPAKKEILRTEKAGITAQITELRKRLKLNEGIEKRSVKIQDTMDMVYANEQKARETQKTKRRELER